MPKTAIIFEFFRTALLRGKDTGMVGGNWIYCRIKERMRNTKDDYV